MSNDLPDKMTGKDLVVQETYEEKFEKARFDSMDSVDRRDKCGHIFSSMRSDVEANYIRIFKHE